MQHQIVTRKQAEQSMGTPSLHGGLEPMKSSGSQLAPLRGSTGNSQPVSHNCYPIFLEKW
jgi:hypothetical protein